MIYLASYLDRSHISEMKTSFVFFQYFQSDSMFLNFTCCIRWDTKKFWWFKITQITLIIRHDLSLEALCFNLIVRGLEL